MRWSVFWLTLSSLEKYYPLVQTLCELIATIQQDIVSIQQEGFWYLCWTLNNESILKRCLGHPSKKKKRKSQGMSEESEVRKKFVNCRNLGKSECLNKLRKSFGICVSEHIQESETFPKLSSENPKLFRNFHPNTSKNPKLSSENPKVFENSNSKTLIRKFSKTLITSANRHCMKKQLPIVIETNSWSKGDHLKPTPP